jgi:hypothetical protein
MDAIEAATDHCIRRGLGFAGLAVGTIMLALSFDMPLALRTGGDLVAVVAVALLLAAWRADKRRLRDSEAWALLTSLRPDFVRLTPKDDAQRIMAAVLRRRLIWHAERLGLGALALWLLMGLTLLFAG